MPDQRSVMKEFRLLDQKRAAEGLTPAEEARLEQLRDLMGPEMGAGGLAGGFDINAAAARLRESLLPAGLRNRPPPEPEAALPVDLPGTEPAETAPAATDALSAAWDEQPFAPLEGEQAQVDPLFDPASLGADGDPTAQQGYDPYAYDPNAYAADPSGQQPYDPNAYAADPNAQQPYDPNAYADPNAQQAWDPNAYAVDPNTQQPYDPNAYAADPNAQQPYDADAYAADPNAQQPYDANAYATDPSAQQPYDPNAYAADPNAPQAWDPNAYATDPNAQQPYDPNAYAVDPNTQQPYDPNAYAADPNAQQPYDPNAYAVDPNTQQPNDPNAYPADPNTEQPYDPNAYPADPNAQQPYDPNAYAVDPNAQQPYDPNAYAADPDAEQPVDLNAAVADPNAEQAWDPSAYAADPNAEQPFDPHAYAADPNAEQPFDPSAYAAPAADAGALEADPSALAAPGYPPPDDDGVAAGWDAAALPAPAAELGAPLGEYDGDAAAPPPLEGLDALEALLPFDAAAAAAIPAGAIPDLYAADGTYDETAGFGAPAGADAGELPPDATAPEPGAAFDGALDLSTPVDGGANGWAAEPELVAAEPVSEGEWQPEAALDHGFQLESGGSFDAGAAAAQPWDAPAEAAAPSEAPAEAAPAPELGTWDGGDLAPPEPAQDLGDAPPPELGFVEGDLAAPEAEPEYTADPAAAAALLGAPTGDLAAPEAEDVRWTAPAWTPPAEAALTDAGEPALPPLELAAPVADDDIPTIDGEEILEEIPVEELSAPPPVSIEFDPLPPPPEPEAPAPAVAAPPAPVAPKVAARPAPVLARPPPVVAIAPRAVAPPAPAPEPDVEVDAEEAVEVDEVVEEAPAATAGSATTIAGSHRVVVHTVEGQVKRGVLDDAELAAAALALGGAPGAAAEAIPTEKVKAIFFMLAPGEQAPTPNGKKVRVTFRDGRQVAGFSPDYREDAVGFFMIPADTRTNTARIWVYQAAVRQVAIS
jgi:hypothetical protein